MKFKAIMKKEHAAVDQPVLKFSISLYAAFV